MATLEDIVSFWNKKQQHFSIHWEKIFHISKTINSIRTIECWRNCEPDANVEILNMWFSRNCGKQEFTSIDWQSTEIENHASPFIVHGLGFKLKLLIFKFLIQNLLINLSSGDPSVEFPTFKCCEATNMLWKLRSNSCNCTFKSNILDMLCKRTQSTDEV